MKRDREGKSLMGLLLRVCSAFYAIQPTIIWSREAMPPMSRPSNANHQPRECPIDILTGQPDGDSFATDVPSSQLTLLCVQVDKKHIWHARGCSD